jgi:hypothetical protein
VVITCSALPDRANAKPGGDNTTAKINVYSQLLLSG